MRMVRASLFLVSALALASTLYADNGAYSGSGGSFSAGTATGASISLSSVPLTGATASLSSSCTITSFGAGTYQWNWICSGGTLTASSGDGSLALSGTFVKGTMTFSGSGGGRGGHVSYWYIFSGTFSGTVTAGGVSESVYGDLSFSVHTTSNSLAGPVTGLSLGWNSAYSPIIAAGNGGNRVLLKADNLTGTNVSGYGTYGSGTGQFETVSGLAHDKSNRIYISDSVLNRVARIDNFSGKNWITLGGPGTGALQFSRPEGVSIDSGGKIWVADAGNDRIVRVDDMTGTNWTTFGSAGTGTNQFTSPAAIAFDSLGRIYIADAGNARLVRMDDLSGTNWTTISTINLSPYAYNLTGINGVLILPSGKIMVSTVGGLMVQMDDMTGANAQIGSWSPSLAGISADPGGAIYAVGGFTPGLAQTLTATGVGFFGGTMGQSSLQPTAVLSIATAVKPPASPTIAPTALSFGSRNVGEPSATQSVTLTNIGATAMPIGSVTAGVDYAVNDACPSSLAGGATCAITVAFDPTATGTRNSTLVINTTSAHPQLVVSLAGTGTAPSVAVLPGSLVFQSQALNSTSGAQTATLSNNGSGPLTIASIKASGDFGVTDNCGTTVAPKNGCTLLVTFTPTAAGTRTGVLSISDDAVPGGTSQTVALSGTGASTAAQVSWSPSSILFPAQKTGTSSPAQTITLTNGSSAALTLSAPAFPVGFAGSTTCGSSLAAGKSCTIQAQFKPTAAGTVSGALTMPIQGQTALSVGLSGTGTQSATPMVAVTPSPLAFTGYVVGDNPTASMTVTNTTGVPVGLFPLQLTGSNTFTITGGGCPAILAGGASCTVQITFIPTVVGTVTATLTVHEQSGAVTQAPISGTAGTNGGGGL